MRRLVALRAEIARSGDEPPPEVPAPHAIDDHARDESWGVAEDALGQFEPAGAVLESGLAFSEHGREAAGHDLAGRSHVPRLQDRHVARLARLVNDEGVARV